LYFSSGLQPFCSLETSGKLPVRLSHCCCIGFSGKSVALLLNPTLHSRPPLALTGLSGLLIIFEHSGACRLHRLIEGDIWALVKLITAAKSAFRGKARNSGSIFYTVSQFLGSAANKV